MGSGDNSSYMTYSILKGDDFKEPMIFSIGDYPSRIRGQFKLRIPLN